MRLLIIGDSMIKYLNEYLISELQDHEVDLISFPGAKIERISGKLSNLGEYEWMLFHVGTNDLAGDVSEILQEYTSLFQELSILYPAAKVVISGIIPRGPNFFLDSECRASLASELELLNQKTSIVNHELEKACLGRKAFYFCQSLGSWKGLWGRDGLHLNRKGNLRLAKMFSQTLGGLIALETAISKKDSPANLLIPMEAAISKDSPAICYKSLMSEVFQLKRRNRLIWCHLVIQYLAVKN